MNSIHATLVRQQLKTFNCSYSTEYKSFIINHIFSDPQHPLHEARRRAHKHRKEEGLWWHITTAATLSKSSVVRSWVRRRLRNAFTEELKARGIREDGRILHKDMLRTSLRGLRMVLDSGKDLSLEGGLRLHARPEVIAAKFVEVRNETGFVIDALLQDLEQRLMFSNMPGGGNRRQAFTDTYTSQRPHARAAFGSSPAQRYTRKPSKPPNTYI